MSERYADVALAHILAVKEYAPEAEFFPVLVNNDSAADGMVWNRVIASKLGKYVNAGVLYILRRIFSTHKSEKRPLWIISSRYSERSRIRKGL